MSGSLRILVTKVLRGRESPNLASRIRLASISLAAKNLNERRQGSPAATLLEVRITDVRCLVGP